MLLSNLYSYIHVKASRDEARLPPKHVSGKTGRWAIGLCYACLPTVAPERSPEENELRDDEMQPGEMAYAVCRSCGGGFFDRMGKRVPRTRICLDCMGQTVVRRQGRLVCAACGGIMLPTLEPEDTTIHGGVR